MFLSTLIEMQQGGIDVTPTQPNSSLGDYAIHLGGSMNMLYLTQFQAEMLRDKLVRALDDRTEPTGNVRVIL